MLFFAAGNFPMMNDPELEALIAMRILKRYRVYCRLVSFFYKKAAELVMQVIQENFADHGILILDSGAYSAFMEGITLDIDEFIDFVKKNINSFDYFFNLDVIGKGKLSYQNYCYLRRAGLDPIPVWHVETDLKFLEAYLREAKYIGIGVWGKNQTSENIAELDGIWANYLTDDQGLPLAKFHLLGVSSAQTISKYPWYSADGTSWANAAWNGSIVVPRRLAGIIRYDETPLTVPVTQRLLDKSGHLANRDDQERKYIYSQISLKIAQFNLDPDLENPTTRDTINLSYYLDLAESQPDWRWAYRRDLSAIYKQIDDEVRKYSRMVKPS